MPTFLSTQLFLGIVLIAVVLVTGAFTYFQVYSQSKLYGACVKCVMRLTPHVHTVARDAPCLVHGSVLECV